MFGSLLGRAHLAALIFFICVAFSQANAANQGAPASQPVLPAVTFTLDFPGANPSHYVISIGRDGRGTYLSNGQLSSTASADSASETRADSADPPLEFTISDRVREQIFDLAQHAHYFSGKIDSGRKGIANTGAKTLSYNDGRRQSQATYNFSTLAPVEQLTAIFQGLSQTLEFGRRLTFFHKYQKTALDEDLKRMEEMQRENSLGDMQAIAPVLKEIADDHSVMNVARSRALRLMASETK